jgi:hypothetical protein
MNSLKQEKYKKYLSTETETMQKHIGIFKNKSEILSFVYAKDNFVGFVSDIYGGYIF